MISLKEWNAQIDAFIKEENRAIGREVPVHRIYCQDDSDRSGGGIYNETVTADTIGRFARALGDSNPLYSDPRYVPVPKAPPLLECCICSTFIAGRMPRLRGVSVFDAGTKWERFAPILPGDVFSAKTKFLGIEELTKPGSADRLLMRSHEITLRNQRDERVSRLTARSLIKCAAPEEEKSGEAEQLKTALSAAAGKTASEKTALSASPDKNRSKEVPSAAPVKNYFETTSLSAGTGKKRSKTLASSPAAGKTGPERAAVPLSSKRGKINAADRQVDESPMASVSGRPHYTEEELERVYANLDAQFEGLFRRGKTPRYWEDVENGEQLPMEIAGPYDESDGQSLMAAIGASNAFATKWGTLRARRKRGGIIDPETGAVRHPIDRHISDTVARTQGLPRAIVSGIHSQALLAKSAGDWMGDAGVLRILDCRCRKPLFYGDLTIQRGRVTSKYEKDGRYYVTLKLEAAREDGVVHTEADAVVELLSRTKKKGGTK